MAINFANNSSLANITSLPASISGGGLTLVSSQTASSSASLEFSMDSTYDSYVFKFINIHAGTRGDYALSINFSIDNGSNYNVSKISTHFRTYHAEDDGGGTLAYDTARDSAGGLTTSDIKISNSQTDTDNNHSASGYLQIFNPSSSVFVKHFISNISEVGYTGGGTGSEIQTLVAGYGNTTSPITNIRFAMSSGNIDDGIIKMYGVS
jgi:hypothetical protein